ncbi:putative haloacid dehalogenase-like hydrolase 5 [Elsinoe fawcettii]|nr:putative haloacid dehalogenase-like hydrolase 5 [Elsinoe fawcettii]
MAEHKVILTLFSTIGSLPSTTWNAHVSELHPTLHQCIPFSQDYTRRFLDGVSSSTTHRVLQLDLPVPSRLSQTSCTTTIHLLTPLISQLNLEATLTPLTPLHRSYTPPYTPSPSTKVSKLAVFDMDSTLISQEVIDELARSLDLYASVSAITEAAMRGEPPYTDFTSSLKARVALLRGVEPTIWSHLKENVITFTPGARELIACLRSDGWTTAVLSGGFINLAEWVKETLGLDYAFANELETDSEGKLTGRVKEGTEVVDGERKRTLMLKIAGEKGVGEEATLAVGDGSNDLLMMGAAGLGVAFCAKPKVQEKAPARVNGGSLVDVLYILGWTEGEIREVMERR